EDAVRNGSVAPAQSGRSARGWRGVAVGTAHRLPAPPHAPHLSRRGGRVMRTTNALPTDHWALLKARQVQDLIGVSRTTLWRWINRGIFPPPDKVLPGGRRAWRRGTVEAWLNSSEPTIRAAA